MSPKILIIYDSRTGRTEKLAEIVAEGARRVSGITVELKKAESAAPKEVINADGYAFGSPSHFSIMSGKMLTLLTDLYFIRQKMAGKPMAVFTTGTGGQVTALENVERIIGVFNPRFVKPGIAIETVPERASMHACSTPSHSENRLHSQPLEASRTLHRSTSVDSPLNLQP